MKRGRRIGVLKSRKGFEFSFAWIFAITAGAVIIFLAVYAAVQFIDVAKTKQSAETAKTVTILIDPLETGIASAVGDVIIFDRETRISVECYTPAVSPGEAFGKQSISVSEKSSFSEKWAEQGPKIFVRNKFIFADEIEQGKKLFVFSKPFEMGFKVSDLIFASNEAENYCFAAPPNEIDDELTSLTLFTNLNVTNTLGECPEASIKVCFNYNNQNCDIIVTGDEESGYVEKDSRQVYYAGSLLYGAIFSSPDAYECNVKRLGKKISGLAEVYNDKINIVAARDCNSAIEPQLSAIAGLSSEIESSSDLAAIYQIAKQMNEMEGDALCKIYS